MGIGLHHVHIKEKQRLEVYLAIRKRDSAKLHSANTQSQSKFILYQIFYESIKNEKGNM